MAATIEGLLIMMVLTVLAFVAAIFVCYLAYTLARAWSRSWDGLAQGFSRWEAKADADERRARIEDQINNGGRVTNSSRGVDSTFVRAAEMSKRISYSLALVKDATKTCCDIQKFTAQVRGVDDMQDIAWDPVCSNLRQYVQVGLEIALEALKSYPIMDRKILKQSIGLDVIRETCAECELLRYTVAGAPALCTPAKSLGNRPGDEKD